MSQLCVQVTTVDEVKEHSNADVLELAVVGGWQCVVKKGVWKAGDKCVYFPPDTILPEEVSDRFEVTKYLSNGRIKCTKLRKEPSFGLVVKPDDPTWPVGTDVAEYYQAKKYEPPVRPTSGPNRSGGRQDHPKFSRYTEIDNLRHFPRAFEDGEDVVVTEKIHGANCRIGVIDGEIVAGSRRLQRERPSGKAGDTFEGATYWWPVKNIPGITSLLTSFIEPQSWWQKLLRRPKQSKTVIIYGEVFGASIQNLDYGHKGNALGFAAFDIMINGEYVDYEHFRSLCRVHRIPTAPELYHGPYSLERVRDLSQGGTMYCAANHIREGVVVRPARERRDPKLGRLVLKYVSDDYLLMNSKTDYTEV